MECNEKYHKYTFSPNRVLDWVHSVGLLRQTIIKYLQISWQYTNAQIHIFIHQGARLRIVGLLRQTISHKILESPTLHPNIPSLACNCKCLVSFTNLELASGCSTEEFYLASVYQCLYIAWRGQSQFFYQSLASWHYYLQELRTESIMISDDTRRHCQWWYISLSVVTH